MDGGIHTGRKKKVEKSCDMMYFVVPFPGIHPSDGTLLCKVQKGWTEPSRTESRRFTYTTQAAQQIHRKPGQGHRA